ncbi:hypothetical protein SK128_021736 [Halocaridina rubra]|uniref:Uncharacterized protein n=1 Tax=Halocaridina rubra TaxID=373956 RepID=A0AAN8X0N1_HALRR
MTRCSSPALARFRMLAKLSRILTTGNEGGEVGEQLPPKAPNGRIKGSVKKLRLLCRMRSALGREIFPRKEPPSVVNRVELKKTTYWRRYPKKTTDPKLAKLALEPEVVAKPKVDPTVEIRLTTDIGGDANLVSYDLKSRSYNLCKTSGASFDILTLPSRIRHKRDALVKKREYSRFKAKGKYTSITACLKILRNKRIDQSEN